MRKIRAFIVLVLLAGAVVNVYLKFWQQWWMFGGVLAWQLLAVKEIWAYLFDRDIKFVRGLGVKKGASHVARNAAGGFYLACYLLMFIVK